MFDYLKMGSRVLILFTILLFSCAFTQTTEANRLEEEREKADIAVAEVTVYIQSIIKQMGFCFVPTKECHDVNQYYVDNIGNIMVENGWSYENYRIVCILLPNRSILIGLQFASLVNPDMMYRATWEIVERYVPHPEKKKESLHVERTRISTDT